MRISPAFIRKSLLALALVIFIINKLMFWLSFHPAFKTDALSHPCACTGEKICRCGPDGCCGISNPTYEPNHAKHTALKSAPCGPLANIDSHIIDSDTLWGIPPAFHVALNYSGKTIQFFIQKAIPMHLLPDPPIPKPNNF